MSILAGDLIVQNNCNTNEMILKHLKIKPIGQHTISNYIVQNTFKLDHLILKKKTLLFLVVVMGITRQYFNFIFKRINILFQLFFTEILSG